MYLPPKKMVEKNGQFSPPPGGVNFVIEFEIPPLVGGDVNFIPPVGGDTPPPIITCMQTDAIHNNHDQTLLNNTLSSSACFDLHTRGGRFKTEQQND